MKNVLIVTCNDVAGGRAASTSSKAATITAFYLPLFANPGNNVRSTGKGIMRNAHSEQRADKDVTKLYRSAIISNTLHWEL